MIEKFWRAGCTGKRGMIQLFSNRLRPLGPVQENGVVIRRISENPNCTRVLREHEYFLVRNHAAEVPQGFAGYLFLDHPSDGIPHVAYQLEPSFSYLGDGDIIKIQAERGTLRTLYRRNSAH